MAIETTIDLNKRLVHHRVSGNLSLEAILAAVDALFRDPEFSPDMNIIAEILPGSTSTLSSDDIHGIVKSARGMNSRQGPGKTAIVVLNDSDYGVFHVLEFLLKDEERELRVLRSLAEAEQWLHQ